MFTSLDLDMEQKIPRKYLSWIWPAVTAWQRSTSCSLGAQLSGRSIAIRFSLLFCISFPVENIEISRGLNLSMFNQNIEPVPMVWKISVDPMNSSVSHKFSSFLTSKKLKLTLRNKRKANSNALGVDITKSKSIPAIIDRALDEKSS